MCPQARMDSGTPSPIPPLLCWSKGIGAREGHEVPVILSASQRPFSRRSMTPQWEMLGGPAGRRPWTLRRDLEGRLPLALLPHPSRPPLALQTRWGKKKRRESRAAEGRAPLAAAGRGGWAGDTRMRPGKKSEKAIRRRKGRRVDEERVSAQHQRRPGGKRNLRFFKVRRASSSKPAQRHFQETAGAAGSAPRPGASSSRRRGGF